MTTKIHTLADGRPLRFILTDAEAHDSTTAAKRLAARAPAGVIADKAYNNNALRALIAKAAVIPSSRSRKGLIPHDTVAYKLRNRIERFFNCPPGDAKGIKLKHFRHIATQYDRQAVHFLAALPLASAMIWMR